MHLLALGLGDGGGCIIDAVGDRWDGIGTG